MQPFDETIRSFGLTPPPTITPGRFHRFPGVGKGRGNTSGWAKLFPDGTAGAFGDFSSSLRELWFADAPTVRTPEAEADCRAQAARALREERAAQAQLWRHAAGEARKTWDAGTEPVPELSPYLIRKQVPGYGIRIQAPDAGSGTGIYRTYNQDLGSGTGTQVLGTDPSTQALGPGPGVAPPGVLLVPLRTSRGQLSSLEFIYPDGTKRYLTGGLKKGCFHLLGEVDRVLCLAEGYATSASIHLATGYACAMAGDAGNLVHVAKALRRRFPDARIVVCADHDKNGVGQNAAHAAAKAIDGLVVVSPIEGQDFNDVHVSEGLDAVKTIIDQTLSHSDPLFPPENTCTPAHPQSEPDSDSGSSASLFPPENGCTPAQPPALATNTSILKAFIEALTLCGVVGEERCASVVFLAVVSRLLDEPVSVVVKGASSTGKSYTLLSTLKFFPDEALITLTSCSPKALIYREDDFAHRTLVLFEATALKERSEEDGGTTAYLVRTLLSEGKIIHSTTVRDQHKGFVARTIVKAGPTNVLITTTAINLHNENETRLISIPTNDSPEQTKRILRELAKGRRDSFVDFSPWHELQTWLKQGEHRVVIPYAEALADFMPPVSVRLRRDFRTLLGFIQSHALLHQATRSRDAEGRIVATVDDYHVVRELIADLIATGVGLTVPDTIRETVKTVELLNLLTGATVRDVAQRLGLDRSAAYRRLESACEKGYLKNLEEKRSRPGRYVIDEPLPDEVPLLPPTISEPAGCAHTLEPAAPPKADITQQEPLQNGTPVQLCSHSQGGIMQETVLSSATSATPATPVTPVAPVADAPVNGDTLSLTPHDPSRNGHAVGNVSPEGRLSPYEHVRHWVSERESARRKKESGAPPPWTDDPILQQYRFCNVRRRHDRVSRWIITNVITPFSASPYLIDWLALGRLVNWPPTLQALLDAGHNPNLEPNWPAIGAFIDCPREEKTFGSAYVISITSNPRHPGFKKPKGEFVTVHLLQPIFQHRTALLNLCAHGPREAVHRFLMKFDGMGSFTAGQVVDDLTWTPLLRNATDLSTWAPLGPGSQRGLNRLAGRAIEKKISNAQGVKEMIQLRERLVRDLPWTNDLTLHDVQNVLCEGDKYLRTLNSEGTPKTKFVSETSYAVPPALEESMPTEATSTDSDELVIYSEVHP